MAWDIWKPCETLLQREQHGNRRAPDLTRVLHFLQRYSDTSLLGAIVQAPEGAYGVTVGQAPRVEPMWRTRAEKSLAVGDGVTGR